MSTNVRSAGVVVFLVTIRLCSPASADLALVPAFQGTFTETWESFPTVLQEGYYLPSPTSVMGGRASVLSPSMVIYEPGILDYGLGSSGYASISDGAKALGSSGFEQSTTIVFAEAMLSFGAYWGAFTHTQIGGDPAWVSVSFFDESDGLIGTEDFAYSRSEYADGLLEWHGWSSTVPVSRITCTEDGVVIDGLQADPVPEPGVIFLVTFAGAMLLRRRGVIRG